MNNSKWLQALKPGDRVAVTNGYRFDNYVIKTVDQVTKTQIIVGGNRYRIKDGHKCGRESYYSSWIQEPTEKIQAEIKKAELENIVNSLSHIIKREAIEKADTSTVRVAINGLRSVIELFRQKESAK